MPVTELQNLRSKYPQYNDIDDVTLSNSLARKYPQYLDLPRKVLDEQLTEQTRLEQEATPEAITKAGIKRVPGFLGERAVGLVKSIPEVVGTVGGGLQKQAETARRRTILPSETPFIAAGEILRRLPGVKEREQSFGILPQVPGEIFREVRERPAEFIGGTAADILLTAGAGAIAGRTLPAIAKAGKAKITATTKGMEEAAERLNNSLIGATKRNIGRAEPGLGMAKEGITGKDFKILYRDTSQRLDELNKVLNDAYNKNSSVIVDVSNTLNPLHELKQKLLRDPVNNAASIKKIDDYINGITGVYGGKPVSTKMTPAEARQFKQVIDDYVDWSLTSKADEAVNKALINSYYNIDDVVDTALPQTRELNKRVSDLITAKRLLKDKIQTTRTKDILPKTAISALNVPFRAMQQPGFKSGLASLLTPGKYPKGTTAQIITKPTMQTPQTPGLLTGQTRLLPSPKDVPYVPTAPVRPKPVITPTETVTGVPEVINVPKTKKPGKGILGNNKGEASFPKPGESKNIAGEYYGTSSKGVKFKVTPYYTREEKLWQIITPEGEFIQGNFIHPDKALKAAFKRFGEKK